MSYNYVGQYLSHGRSSSSVSCSPSWGQMAPCVRAYCLQFGVSISPKLCLKLINVGSWLQRYRGMWSVLPKERTEYPKPIPKDCVCCPGLNRDHDLHCPLQQVLQLPMKHSYSRRTAEDTDMEELHGALLTGRTQTEVFRVFRTLVARRAGL